MFFFLLMIFEGKFSQQSTKVDAKGWCEMVSREIQRRLRVQCCGGAQNLPMNEEPGKPAETRPSAKASAAYVLVINWELAV